MKSFLKHLIPTIMAATICSGAVAQSQGQGPLALRGLEGQIVALESKDGNAFEIGALQVLRAVEKTLQARYEYGLGDSMLNMPLLRLQMRGIGNPRPKASGPETLTTIINMFVSDMTAARATLSKARADGVQPFELTVDDLWFDANLNGRADRGESAVELLGPLFLNRRSLRGVDQNGTGFVIRFDEADHAWLVAYTHMLSGFGNAFMAFDPTPVFARLTEGRERLKQVPRLPEYYDLAEVSAEIATIKARQDEIKARLSELRALKKPLDDTARDLRREMNKPENKANKDAFRARIDAINEQTKPYRDEERELFRDQRQGRAELRSAEAKLPTGGDNRIRRSAEEFRPTLDAIYVLIAALKQQPDTAHIQAAMADWRAMIAENRRFWALVEAETDNDREWIPNARQTPVLPVEIDPALAGAWQDVLADVEALLDGRLLIPHPLFPAGHGVSLAHYEQYPTPIDLTDAIHGIGLYEHAARGPMISPQSWQTFERLARGRGGLFAVWFN